MVAAALIHTEDLDRDRDQQTTANKSVTNEDQDQDHDHDQEDGGRNSPIIIDDDNDDIDIDPNDPVLPNSRLISPSPTTRLILRPRTRTITFTQCHNHCHKNQRYGRNSNYNFKSNFNSEFKSNSNSTLNPKSSSSPSQSSGSFSYKDVVVIGNGPSGIVLSYFLAGNWPYYNGLGENANEMLHYRLLTSNGNGKNKGKSPSLPQTDSLSLVEQDLNFLSQGLEGRSTNPVALLFDSLNHPQADLGLELPSLLNWRVNPEQKLDHVVIGKGPPGGAWQSMDGNVLTISLGCWMELPEMNFREWEAQQETRCCRESRASVASVAQYYCDYVRKHGLEKYFLCDSVVTQVTKIDPNDPSHYQDPDLLKIQTELENGQENVDMDTNSDCLPVVCDNYYIGLADASRATKEKADRQERIFRRHTISEIPLNNLNPNPKFRRRWNRPLWKVKGYTRVPQEVGEGNCNSDIKNTMLKPFSYITPNIVLATGASDKPNVLNVPGENLPFVLHSLNDLEHLIEAGILNRDSDPVLIVGAGLCAADAIIAARFHSVPVVHCFRRNVRDPDLIFRQLPENMYPEYHKVYQMMQDPVGYDNYTAYSEHVVIEIRPDGKINLSGPNSSGTIKVSYIAICIGNQPDLSCLGEDMESNLGVHPSLPIDCKRNPVSIDYYSHQSTRYPGLYALGPVVGENFVRFLQGGALAVTNHLVQQRQQQQQLALLQDQRKQQHHLQQHCPVSIPFTFQQHSNPKRHSQYVQKQNSNSESVE